LVNVHVTNALISCTRGGEEVFDLSLSSSSLSSYQKEKKKKNEEKHVKLMPRLDMDFEKAGPLCIQEFFRQIIPYDFQDAQQQ